METKTTTPARAAAMSAAEITTTAAAIVLRYKTISEIKAHAAGLRDKYGRDNWTEILRNCKALRAADIDKAAKAAKARVFSYRPILAAAFKALSSDPDFRALCKYAKAVYNKGTDTDTAAALVRDYYSNVDTDGAPLVRVNWADAEAALVFVSYEYAAETDALALSVLKACVTNMARAAKTAARKGSDTAAATISNVRPVGTITAVYEPRFNEDGGAVLGEPLTGPRASTDKAKEKTVKAAAALIGRKVPAGVVRLSELSAAGRAAHRAAADKALKESRAAIAADAKAAGVGTAAPAKRTSKAAKTADTAAAVTA